MAAMSKQFLTSSLNSDN